jgi:hypothetical protein
MPLATSHIFDDAMKAQHTATPQALVTQVELALQRVIHTAAVKTIGQKRVRRGATKAWMTTALRRLLDSRRRPLLRMDTQPHRRK